MSAKVYQAASLIICILAEKFLVSDRYGYGGTLDLFATLTVGKEDFRELIDFKTGKAFYPTHYAQLAALWHLLVENGYAPENARLVKLPVEPDKDTFDEAQLVSLEKYWKLFLHCLSIYKMGIL